MTHRSARSPCLTAFCDATAFPSAVLGPVDFSALRRLARTCASLAMTESSQMAPNPVQPASDDHVCTTYHRDAPCDRVVPTILEFLCFLNSLCRRFCFVGAGPCACPHTAPMLKGNHRGLPLPMTVAWWFGGTRGMSTYCFCRSSGWALTKPSGGFCGMNVSAGSCGV